MDQDIKTKIKAVALRSFVPVKINLNINKKEKPI